MFKRSLRCVLSAAAVATVFSCGLQAPAQDPLPKLPEVGMFFVSQNHGAPQRMHGTEIGINTHTGTNLARGLVYAGPQHTVEIPDTSASLVLQDRQPDFYVRLGSEDPDIVRRQVTLVQLTVNNKAKARTLCTFTANAFGGNRQRHENTVGLVKIDTTSDTVLKLSLVLPLEPGEYALAMMPSSQVQTPTVVYDFTVPDKPK